MSLVRDPLSTHTHFGSRGLDPRRLSGGLVVALALTCFAASASATALFDFGDGPVLAGWAGVPSANPAATSDGIQLTLSATASEGFDDRDRAAGGNGGGAESDMWRDFFFAVPDDDENEALLIELSGLTPGASYDVTVWSYDSAGGTSRVSRWNGVTYSFDPQGTLPPETLDDLNIMFRIEADAFGLAQVLGESLESDDPGAFINGMRVVLVPEPGTGLLLALGLGLLTTRRPSRSRSA